MVFLSASLILPTWLLRIPWKTFLPFFLVVSLSWLIWKNRAPGDTNILLFLSVIILVSWLQCAKHLHQSRIINALRLLVRKLDAQRQSQAVQISNHWKTEAALQSLGYYASAVLHNIAMPVSTLNSLVFEISHQLSNQQRKDIDSCLRYVSAVIRHSRRHITNETPASENINVRDAFHETLNIVHNVAVRQGIALVIHCPASLSLKGDPVLLRQMLLNLVQNGLEAMADSTVGKITLQAKRQSDTLRIYVIDTGRGMPAEQLSQVGTRFFTVKQDRTGLGTAFVKETIGRYFQGTCQYQSIVGKGTTATLSFPLESPSSPVY